MEKLKGIGVSSGSVIGRAYVLKRQAVVIPDVPDPKAAFAEAADSVKADLLRLSDEAKLAGRAEAAEVLKAQSYMAEDPMLSDAVAERLDEGMSFQSAVEEATAALSAMLAAMPDEYLAARAADVTEVGDRVRRHLAGVESGDLGSLDAPSIVVAETLTAAETAVLDPEMVLAFVTEQGGPTSHVAVIARSLDMPAVVAVSAIVDAIDSGMRIAVDADSGEVVIDPDGDAVEDFEARHAADLARRDLAAAYRGVSIEFGGSPFSVAANVGGPEDVTRAVDAKADGIGLYRTEFLFLDREEPPTEEEQYEVYRAALEAFDHPVVVRTFDIGGDKPATYLATEPEENPFLGERGVRIYERFDDLFAGQVRALLRASVAGDLWVMIPMIATVDGFTTTKRRIERVRAELEAEGVPVGNPKLGVMIEVPSAALIADRLANHADFFSIGTNDLTQYAMAADRTNGALAWLSDAAHPAVLALCDMTAKAATAGDIPASVCGEAAADPVLSVLFAAMGITKLSVSAPSVDRVKSVVDRTDVSEARSMLERCLAAESAEEVRSIVGDAIT